MVKETLVTFIGKDFWSQVVAANAFSMTSSEKDYSGATGLQVQLALYSVIVPVKLETRPLSKEQ